MPGIRSLEAAQYYAHPQNAFWKVMAELFGAPVETYAQRVALIKKNNLALWDVLKCCQRTGSLDSSIDDKTIEVNDCTAFLTTHPKITRVFFNGAKAEKEFLKRVLPQLPEKIRARLTLARLPSTSPAHAGMKPAAKVKAWRAVRDA